MATILISADVCPIGNNIPLFASGDAAGLLTDLLPEFESSDLTIANLECPLIETPSPILKTGPTFGGSTGCIKGIQAAGIDVLGLANNHIMDHGAAGLKNTIEVCARAGIATVGAGENLAAARKLLIREVGGLRVAVLAVAEHEFSIAGKNSWGANPLDPIDFVRNLKDNCDRFDYLIVLLHGGDEFFVPSPGLRNTCRFMIECGANAVIVQHPHCLGGYEHYRNGHIVYGQGALLMDEAIYRNLPSFHEGFVIKLSITDDRDSSLGFIPFSQSDPAPGARKMKGETAKALLDRLDKSSARLERDGWVEEQWLQFCTRARHDYLSSLLAHNRILGRLNANGLLERWLHGRMPLLRARNIVCCETHREVIETIFNNRLV